MAERLFRARVEGTSIRTVSAGIAGLVGYSMDAPSATVLCELGGDSRGHVSQRLDRQMIADAALILTAETQHRSVLVQTDPLSFRRTFTLREFGRLGTALGPLQHAPTPDVLRSRVGEVADQRGCSEPVEPGADDIGDPFGASIKVARACGRHIVEAVDSVVRALGLTG